MDTTDQPSPPISPHAIILPIFSGLAILLLIVPFIWHYKNKNVGACSLIFYITLNNLFTFINAIIWPSEDFANWWIGTGLCDVEVKLQLPLTTGIASATLCITRNLANVLDVDRISVSESTASRRRRIIIDCLICFGVPVLQIALHYIVQPNRYYIAAIGGCLASYDNSWPTIVLFFIWPLLFSLINCYYAILVIVRLHKHRTQFAKILSHSTSGLTLTRFLRLFIMSLTLLLIYTPVSTYFFILNVSIPWLPYSWNLIHYPSELWNTIIFFPAEGARTFDHYVPIAMAVFVFFYFGMGADAVEIYRRTAVRLGLGRVWPRLLLVRGRRESVDSQVGGWFKKFSLIRWLRRYFERVRTGSGSEGLTEMEGMRLNKTATRSSAGRKFSTTATTQSIISPMSPTRDTDLDFDDVNLQDISPTSFISTQPPAQVVSQPKPLPSFPPSKPSQPVSTPPSTLPTQHSPLKSNPLPRPNLPTPPLPPKSLARPTSKSRSLFKTPSISTRSPSPSPAPSITSSRLAGPFDSSGLGLDFSSPGAGLTGSRSTGDVRTTVWSSGGADADSGQTRGDDKRRSGEEADSARQGRVRVQTETKTSWEERRWV